MRWSRARYRTWLLPVIWDVEEQPPAKLTATAETVQQVTVVHVHRHLHLTHGGDAAGLGLALPPGAAAAGAWEESRIVRPGG